MSQLRMLVIAMLIFVAPAHSQSPKPVQVDVCIYGATSAGIIAAYTAKKLHQTVLVVDPGKHIGGLTSGGLGFTDIGNKYAVTGLKQLNHMLQFTFRNGNGAFYMVSQRFHFNIIRTGWRNRRDLHISTGP